MEEQMHIAQKLDEDLLVDVSSTLLPSIHPLQLRIPTVKDTQVEEDLATLHEPSLTRLQSLAANQQPEHSSLTEDISHSTTPMPTSHI